MENGTSDEVLSRLAETVGSITPAHPIRVAVDGPPAAGKTTLADELVNDGEIGVGTRGVEVRRLFGREFRAPFDITRHEPPNRQDFHTTGGPIRPDGVLHCESVGKATKVTYEFQLGGAMGWLFARGDR